MDTRYNGYRNRATWNVVLWLMNDEELYMAMQRELAIRGNKITSAGTETLCRGLFGDTTPDGDKLRAVHWPEVRAAILE